MKIFRVIIIEFIEKNCKFKFFKKKTCFARKQKYGKVFTFHKKKLGKKEKTWEMPTLIVLQKGQDAAYDK